MLICFGFWLYGKPFISFWIGGGFDLAYVCALILMIALIIPLIQNTGVVILQAKNKHSFRSIVYVIIALLNLSFSIPVAKHYGAIGCATVTGLCLLLGPGLIINIYYAKIGINVLSFFRSICSTLLPMIIAVA
jgi:O-antigen/teichoic acid export membrane protein